MSKKYIQKATREGRVALLPEWLREGCRVWYWRESFCGDDCCSDMVTSCCPLNNGHRMGDAAARECARQHPVLEEAVIWSVGAFFKPGEIYWSVNELDGVPDRRLRESFFPSRKEALKNKPGRVV